MKASAAQHSQSFYRRSRSPWGRERDMAVGQSMPQAAKVLRKLPQPKNAAIVNALSRWSSWLFSLC